MKTAIIALIIALQVQILLVAYQGSVLREKANILISHHRVQADMLTHAAGIEDANDRNHLIRLIEGKESP